MRPFVGQFERSIDAKARLQLPSQVREDLERIGNGRVLYVTLGEEPNTLSIYPESVFDDLSSRMETELRDDDESVAFERQFYALAQRVTIDGAGRILLPDNLRNKARLGTEVYLVGRKTRLDIWNRAEFDKALGIDWEGDQWPGWRKHLRMRPQGNGHG